MRSRCLLAVLLLLTRMLRCLSVDMIPLLMQKGYKANGWLGLILGTRLYYAFHGAESDDEAAFEQRMDNLCRESGSRGQHQLSESVPTARAAAGPSPECA